MNFFTILAFFISGLLVRFNRHFAPTALILFFFTSLSPEYEIYYTITFYTLTGLYIYYFYQTLLYILLPSPIMQGPQAPSQLATPSQVQGNYTFTPRTSLNTSTLQEPLSLADIISSLGRSMETELPNIINRVRQARQESLNQ